MAWQNCELHEWIIAWTRMIAFNQFLFIDQITGLKRWTLPFPERSARVWPVGEWNFDLANSDALVSMNSRASDGFAIRPTSGWNVLPRKIVLHCTRMRECAVRPFLEWVATTHLFEFQLSRGCKIQLWNPLRTRKAAHRSRLVMIFLLFQLVTGDFKKLKCKS